MTATHTALPELQQAMYATLTGNVPFMSLITGVFDFGGVPQNQAFPYVTLGDATEGSLNAFQLRGYQSTLTVHIWSMYFGFGECYIILDAMNNLLDQQILSLPTHRHVYTLYDFGHPMVDPTDERIRHMVVRYRTFTQE